MSQNADLYWRLRDQAKKSKQRRSRSECIAQKNLRGLYIGLSEHAGTAQSKVAPKERRSPSCSSSAPVRAGSSGPVLSRNAMATTRQCTTELDLIVRVRKGNKMRPRIEWLLRVMKAVGDVENPLWIANFVLKVDPFEVQAGRGLKNEPNMCVLWFSYAWIRPAEFRRKESFFAVSRQCPPSGWSSPGGVDRCCPDKKW